MSDPQAILASEKKQWLRVVGQIATIAISVLMVWYFLRKVNWQELQATASKAELIPACLGSAFPFFFYWITDAAFTVKSIEWFHEKRVPFRDYFIVKAAGYLLTMVNIVFGASGTFLYLMRKAEIGADKQAGIFAFRIVAAVAGAILLYGLFAIGMFIYEPNIAKAIGSWIWILVFALFGLALVEMASIWMRGKGLLTGLLVRNRSAEFWTAFREARRRHWLAALLYTLPPLLGNYLCQYLVARSFHINVPILDFLFWVPLVSMISALPVAFGGFGTTTAAWTAFYGTFGGNTDIVAATLFMPTVRLIVRAATGGAFMPSAMKEIRSIIGKKPN